MIRFRIAIYCSSLFFDYMQLKIRPRTAIWLQIQLKKTPIGNADINPEESSFNI